MRSTGASRTTEISRHVGEYEQELLIGEAFPWSSSARRAPKSAGGHLHDRVCPVHLDGGDACQGTSPRQVQARRPGRPAALRAGARPGVGHRFRRPRLPGGRPGARGHLRSGGGAAALGAHVTGVEPAGGLNAALRYGASEASLRWPGSGVAALAADLPALRPAELRRALRAASRTGAAAFGPDAAGVGTTMYAVVPGGSFRPMFEGASRARHASSGAVELSLDGVPGLRRDVDTPEDLRAAVLLGAGSHTAAVAAELLADA